MGCVSPVSKTMPSTREKLERDIEQLDRQMRDTLPDSPEAEAIRKEYAAKKAELLKCPPNGNADAPAAWDIFICYAREDLPTATRLHDELARAGIAAWLDKKRLIGGQNWKIEVKKAMQRSRCILALLSSHSVSKSGYVQKELREALEMLEHLPPDRILIIPVRLDDCEPAHEQLRDLQWIDLFESHEEGLAQIVQAFRFSAESVGAYNDTPLQNVTIDLSGGVTLDLLAIPGGTFWMGSPDGVGEKNEHPRHQVTLAPFLMGKYPVTQAEWQAVMGNNPSKFKDADRPVECVSWDECQEFLKKLNATVETHGRASLQFRLPTEAEWEYACRAGSETIWHFGNDSAQLENYAWHDENSRDKTHAVGKLQPNAFDLYDMYGNVWEWCQDWFNETYYANSPRENPAGQSSGKYRLLRGGSWYNLPDGCRSACRGSFASANQGSNIGCRVVAMSFISTL